MSKSIICNSCGGVSLYQSDKSSVKCEFCGSIINIPSENIASIESKNTSRLKAKPEITRPKEKLNSNPPRFNQPHRLARVDNGWNVFFEDGSWNLYWQEAPEQLLNLYRYLIQIPEYQLS